MHDALLEYARFHAVREVSNDRSKGVVPVSTALQRFKLTTMPIAIFVTLLISVGTTVAAEQALPGDILYPVKTGVNEEVFGAFAIGANAKAEHEAAVLAERLAEAETLQATGRLEGAVAAHVAEGIKAQIQSTNNALAQSDSTVAATINARLSGIFEQFALRVGTDTVFALNLADTLMATSESQGTISATAFLQDTQTRINSLQGLVETYATDIGADVQAELSTKLSTAAALAVQAEQVVDADAQTLLNQAATVAGEVEAKLSTLGQATVDGNGMITAIDFSIDPLARTKAEVATDTLSNADTASSSIEGDVEAAIMSEPLDVEIDAGLEATSGLGI